VLLHLAAMAATAWVSYSIYGRVIENLLENVYPGRVATRPIETDDQARCDRINAACEEVMTVNGHVDAYMRPVAWRGSESMGVAPGKTKPHLAIAAWEWGKYYDPRKSENGIRLDIAPWRRPAPYTAPTESKAAGLYMICTLSKQHAEQRGYDDALMFDWRGRVAEATGANVFFVKENKLHTPTPDCFLDGITRRTIMDLADRRGIEVSERPIWPEELESFEQMFLTGTAVEVTPVKSVGPWNFEVGEMTRQISRDYDDLVHGRIPNE